MHPLRRLSPSSTALRASHDALASYRQHATSPKPALARRLHTTTPISSPPKPPPNRPRIIFSGIQPTGIPHLGNYLGAIQPWTHLQHTSPPSDALIFAVVDLHSLTSRSQTADERRSARRDTLAVLLACGLDPERCILYYQSVVPQHTELHWILSCDASMGWLSRMSTWKSKLSDDEAASLLVPSPNPRSAERLKLGLFSYPVLQAADILLYGATHVPVGEDQVAHIEFARGAAAGFNHAFGGGGAVGPDGRKKKGKTLLVEPETLVSPAKRVMSLAEPGRKMSKSHELERSRVLLSDDPETVRWKFRQAVTDSIEGVSWDKERRPGVANLLEIVSFFDEAGRGVQDVVAETREARVEGSVLKLLKDVAADKVVRHLTPIRERYLQLKGREGVDGYLDEVAEIGRVKACERAERTMRVVRDAVGL